MWENAESTDSFIDAGVEEASLDADIASVCAMPLREVENGLREMGLDPERPLPRKLVRLIRKRRRATFFSHLRGRLPGRSLPGAAARRAPSGLHSFRRWSYALPVAFIALLIGFVQLRREADVAPVLRGSQTPVNGVGLKSSSDTEAGGAVRRGAFDLRSVETPVFSRDQNFSAFSDGRLAGRGEILPSPFGAGGSWLSYYISPTGTNVRALAIPGGLSSTGVFGEAQGPPPLGRGDPFTQSVTGYSTFARPFPPEAYGTKNADPIALSTSPRLGFSYPGMPFMTRVRHDLDTPGERSLINERFYLGDEFSIRGYNVRSVGPLGPSVEGTGPHGNEVATNPIWHFSGHGINYDPAPAPLSRSANNSADFGYILKDNRQPGALIASTGEFIPNVIFDFPADKRFQTIVELKSVHYAWARLSDSPQNSPIAPAADVRVSPRRWFGISAGHNPDLIPPPVEFVLGKSSRLPGDAKESEDVHGFGVQFFIGHRNEQPPTIFPNQPPTVALKSSASRVTLAAQCPPGQTDGPSCGPSSPGVQLTADASDPDGDTLLYTWTVTAGRIVGHGAKVTWDPTGVSPGTYIVTVKVDDGCGAVASTTTTITVEARVSAHPATPLPTPNMGDPIPATDSQP